MCHFAFIAQTIIGYYASWQWYDRDGLAAPINMDFSKITRANFAFFQITEEGYIYGTDVRSMLHIFLTSSAERA